MIGCLLNSELEIVWKEAFVTSWKFYEENERGKKPRQSSVYPVSEPRAEIYRIRRTCRVQLAATSGPALVLLSVVNDVREYLLAQCSRVLLEKLTSLCS
jgi:hypothetical protein